MYACREFRQFFLSRYGLVFFLTGSHRQANDSWFVGCLDRGRKGEVSDADLMVLIATSDGVAAEAWNERTQLRALNVEVDAFNRGKLSRLPGAEVVYSCRDEVAVGITHPARRAYAQRCMLEIDLYSPGVPKARCCCPDNTGSERRGDRDAGGCPVVPLVVRRV